MVFLGFCPEVLISSFFLSFFFSLSSWKILDPLFFFRIFVHFRLQIFSVSQQSGLLSNSHCISKNLRIVFRSSKGEIRNSSSLSSLHDLRWNKEEKPPKNVWQLWKICFISEISRKYTIWKVLSARVMCLPPILLFWWMKISWKVSDDSTLIYRVPWLAKLGCLFLSSYLLIIWF